jgi:hypothetical protein
VAQARDDPARDVTPERWRQIEELFHEARERTPADRPVFLETACSGDSDLRREVASLLTQRDGSLLGAGVEAIAAAVVTGDRRGNHEGRHLGPYVLGALLGAGGMGDVYRARDAKLGRDVAVKILPDSLVAHPERLARSEREARILAALNHPNIAAIYGLEESDGLRGLVLELVDGPTLSERLETTQALPVNDALASAEQIARALEAAHAKGIAISSRRTSRSRQTVWSRCSTSAWPRSIGPTAPTRPPCPCWPPATASSSARSRT